MTNERPAPPSRVRITRLADAQLDGVMAVERERARMYADQGIKGVHARALADVVKLTKQHNVRVAEADDKVAGWLAWRDESPGVGVIEELAVHPESQRVGIGQRLLGAIRDEARAVRLPQVIVRIRAGAPWAEAFFARAGFKPIDDAAPARVRAWVEEQTAGDKPLVAEGEKALWAEV